jgi:hypothetical protein
MNTMSNPQCQGNDWIDALELPPPHTVEYEPHKRRAQWTAEQMRAFARKAVAESEARRQGEAVAILTAPPHHLELTSEGFDLPDGEYKLFTHPQPLPAPSPEVVEKLNILATFAHEILMGAFEPCEIVGGARDALHLAGLAELHDVVALATAMPAPVGTIPPMYLDDGLTSNPDWLSFKHCALNPALDVARARAALKTATNGGAKI